MSNCTQINAENPCLSCNGLGYWKGYNNAKFPQTDASYNRFQTNSEDNTNLEFDP